MSRQSDQPLTLGCISTWPIYQGSTLDRYAHSLIRGISAAAHDRGCHLLMGCGISSPSGGLSQRNVWPVPGPGIDFVPVGPWNTDGLIVIPDDLSTPQAQYLHDLQVAGFPIIFTTPEGPGAIVAVDNASGIQQAFTHLLEHGHQQIAFIAGKSGRGGDSAERLQAYRAALREADLPEVPRLMAYGEHRFQAGKMAMQQILASGIPFTALIASNDLSCLGAMECLTEAGLRVPDDVAVIGFDDILDARAHSPSLTTIRHPTFVLGYQAVITLLDETGLSWLLGRACDEAGVPVSPSTPLGVELIKRSDGTRTWLFALNYSTQEVEVALEQSGHDLITGARFDKSVRLGPLDIVIIQKQDGDTLDAPKSH